MGRKPDRPEYREHVNLMRNYLNRPLRAVSVADPTVLQPIGYKMDQKQLPDCVGKAFQGRINALLQVDPSGVELWIACRSFDGNLLDATQGTTAESAIEILLADGWLPRTDPSEDDTAPDDPKLVELADLDQELEGADNRLVLMDHEVFTGTDDTKHTSILEALRERDSQGRFVNALVFGTGVNDSYMNPPGNTILDESYLSPDAPDGHEQGLIGWSEALYAYIVAGSWGDWTYCTVTVDGVMHSLPGCCLVSRGVIEHAWDVDKLRVR